MRSAAGSDPRRGLAAALALATMLAVAVPAGAQAPVLAPTYRLGPGDVLEVSVFGYPDLARGVTVGPDGRISLPLVGEVLAAGKTVEELQQELTRRYERYIRKPRVTVTIREFRRVQVSVVGQVGRPGTYALQPGARIVDAVAAAGGLLETADRAGARLMRPDGSIAVLDLERAQRGEPGQNLLLVSGDALVVPEDLAGVVYVFGEVQKPGAIRLRGELRILEALALSGGFTEKAGVDRARLVRNKNVTVQVDFAALLVRGDTSQNLVLQPGDMLFVPEDLENRVYVMGEVNRPGIYPLRLAQTVVGALTLAGGLSAKASGRDAYVVRRGGPAAQQNGAGSPREPIRVDLVAVLRRGDRSKDVRLEPGDVLYVPQGPVTFLQLILAILTGVRSIALP